MYAGDELYDDDVTSGVPVEGPVPTAIQNRWNASYEDDDDDCSRCGGDGFEECNDWIQCLRSYHIANEHECSACHGTGLAKDQTSW